MAGLDAIFAPICHQCVMAYAGDVLSRALSMERKQQAPQPSAHLLPSLLADEDRFVAACPLACSGRSRSCAHAVDIRSGASTGGRPTAVETVTASPGA